MIEIGLLITSGIFAILYGIELMKNIKLKEERDIEFFEKKHFEKKVKKLENDEARGALFAKLEFKNKRIAGLCSKIQNKDITIGKLNKIIDKLKGDEKDKRVG